MDLKLKKQIQKKLGVFNKLINDFNTIEELETEFFFLTFCDSWVYSEYASKLFNEPVVFPGDDNYYEEWVERNIEEGLFTQEDFTQNELEYTVDFIWYTQLDKSKMYIFTEDKKIKSLIDICMKQDEPYWYFDNLKNNLLKTAFKLQLEHNLSNKPMVKQKVNKI